MPEEKLECPGGEESASGRPRGRLDDFTDSNAEILVQNEYLTASDSSPVDVDVDWITGSLVEFDHGIRRQTEDILDEHLGAAQLDSNLELHVIKQPDRFIHGADAGMSRQIREIGCTERLGTVGPLGSLGDSTDRFSGSLDGPFGIVRWDRLARDLGRCIAWDLGRVLW